MDTTTILIIFAILVVVVIGTIYLVKYLRNRKGNITLNLGNGVFTYGQPILGNFQFLAKKDIESTTIIAELSGYVRTFIYNNGTKSYDSKDVQFHYDKVVIESQAMIYPAGTQKAYSFSINTPPTFPQKVVKKRSFYNSIYTSSELDRYLKITVEAKGLDIVGQQRIYIN